jgi:hypothetical protein
MLSKKAKEFSLRTIVVAVLILTVLVIILIIFTGGMGQWFDEFGGILQKKTCGDAGGQLASISSGCPDGSILYAAARDIPTGQICCIAESGGTGGTTGTTGSALPCCATHSTLRPPQCSTTGGCIP